MESAGLIQWVVSLQLRLCTGADRRVIFAVVRTDSAIHTLHLLYLYASQSALCF